MKISSSYPYPVLQKENDDYIESKFEANFEVMNSFGELKIYAQMILDNPGIQDLIMSEDAKFMLHVECPKTSYREAFKFTESILETNIPTSKLSGKVEIHSFVVADKNIINYGNSRLNEWYEEIDISFDKGNFLAIGSAIEVMLNEDHTDMLDLPSIINIQRAKKKEFMGVNYFSNNIEISLPSKEYDLYASYANHMLKQSIISIVILPSLVQVFSEIEGRTEDLEEYVWFQVLEKIFTENGEKFEDVGTERLPALQAAQMVLRKPIQSSFKEIENLNDMED